MIASLLCLLAFLIYGKFAWACYLYTGIRQGKRTADLLDLLHSIAFTAWLFWAGQVILPCIGIALWLATNLNREAQGKIRAMLDEERRRYRPQRKGA